MVANERVDIKLTKNTGRDMIAEIPLIVTQSVKDPNHFKVHSEQEEHQNKDQEPPPQRTKCICTMLFILIRAKTIPTKLRFALRADHMAATTILEN